MKDNDILWGAIKEKRNAGFVSYSPPHPTSWLAHLRVVVLVPLEKNELADLLEKEFQIWATQYAVPLYATLSNDEDDGFDLSGVRPTDTITGYLDPDTKRLNFIWGLMANDDFPDRIKDKDYQIKIFAGLSHRTGKQVRENADNNLKKIRTAKRVLLAVSFFRIFIIPLVKDLFGIFGKVYGYFKDVIEFLKLKGSIKRSKKEEEKAKREQLHKHYIYHCERNPEGFARLMAENLEKDIRERIHKEARDIADDNLN